VRFDWTDRRQGFDGFVNSGPARFVQCPFFPWLFAATSLFVQAQLHTANAAISARRSDSFRVIPRNSPRTPRPGLFGDDRRLTAGTVVNLFTIRRA